MVMNKKILVTGMCLAFIAGGCGNQQDQSGAQGGDVKSVVQQATQASGQLQQNIQQTADDLTKKAQTLLTQAQQYLDQGKFDEAVSLAQNVLSFDPQNIDAQKIIDAAKAKLKALAEQKAQDLKSGLMNIGTTEQ
jgi:Tfp pilus assembly protein PilF